MLKCGIKAIKMNKQDDLHIMNNTTTSNCPSLQHFDYKEEEEEVRAQALKEQVIELQMELSEEEVGEFKRTNKFLEEKREEDMKRLYDHFANENLITKISAQVAKRRICVNESHKTRHNAFALLEMKEELNTLKELSHENKKQIRVTSRI